MEEAAGRRLAELLQTERLPRYGTSGYRGGVDFACRRDSPCTGGQGRQGRLQRSPKMWEIQRKIKYIPRRTPVMVAQVVLQVTDKMSMRSKYKRCLELLHMAHQKQPFSTGSRRRAREVKQSWHLRYGPENVWQTANFADTKRVLFELFHQGTVDAHQRDTGNVVSGRAAPHFERGPCRGAALHNAENGERFFADGIAARTFAPASGVLGEIITAPSALSTAEIDTSSASC